MSQRNRALVALAAVVVLVAAFLVLRPGDDDRSTSSTTENAATTPATPAATTPGTTATTATTPRPAAPRVVTVRAVDLRPVGGIRSIEVDKGDTVRFTVTSDRPEEVHLHGYDVEKPVAPGRPARFVFKATIEGIFEVELENAGVQLIKLTVEP